MKPHLSFFPAGLACLFFFGVAAFELIFKKNTPRAELFGLAAIVIWLVGASLTEKKP